MHPCTMYCRPYRHTFNQNHRYWDTRPTAVITRIVQLLTIAGSFLGGLAMDFAQGE